MTTTIEAQPPIARSREIGELIAVLLSEPASLVTGAVIVVDRGLRAGLPAPLREAA